ncbi:hypothetical protein Tco_0618326 [Tanacetum coccineum]
MWLRRGDDGGGVAGLRGTPAGGEGKWRVRSGGDGGIWQRREWLVRSYGDSSGGSQMAAGGGMATRGACWYGESGRCRSGGSIFVYWPEIFRWPNDRCGGVAFKYPQFVQNPSLVCGLDKCNHINSTTTLESSFMLGFDNG